MKFFVWITAIVAAWGAIAIGVVLLLPNLLAAGLTAYAQNIADDLEAGK